MRGSDVEQSWFSRILNHAEMDRHSFRIIVVYLRHKRNQTDQKLYGRPLEDDTEIKWKHD